MPTTRCAGAWCRRSSPRASKSPAPWGMRVKIADCAPLGVQGVLHSTRTAQVEDHDAAVAEMYKRLVPVMASADAAEGLHSFMEQRKAVFTGH